MWCLMHPTSTAKTFRTGDWLGDRGVTPDSRKAAARCPNGPAELERTGGLPTASRLHPSSHGIPMLALDPLSWRITKLQQGSCHQRLAVTRTAGRAGRRPAVVGPDRERVRSGGAGRPSLGIATSDRSGAKMGDRQPASKLPRAQFPPVYPRMKLEFSAGIFWKNPPRWRCAWKLIGGNLGEVVPELFAEFVTREMTVRCEGYGRHAMSHQLICEGA